MNHDESKVQLWAYLDGGLGAAEMREIQEHIEECPDCFASLESMIQVEKELKAGATLLGTRFVPNIGAGVGVKL